MRGGSRGVWGWGRRERFVLQLFKERFLVFNDQIMKVRTFDAKVERTVLNTQ